MTSLDLLLGRANRTFFDCSYRAPNSAANTTLDAAVSYAQQRNQGFVAVLFRGRASYLNGVIRGAAAIC
jgi:hypothetical protein